MLKDNENTVPVFSTKLATFQTFLKHFRLGFLMKSFLSRNTCSRCKKRKFQLFEKIFLKLFTATKRKVFLCGNTRMNSHGH